MKISPLIFMLFMFACTYKHEQKKLSKPDDSRVVLVVSGLRMVGQTATINGKPATIEMPELWYKNNLGENIPIQINFEKPRDTIEIPTRSNTIVLNYKINPLCFIQYLSHSGDTLFLTNKGNRPELTVLNRKSSRDDLNYEINYLNVRPNLHSYNVNCSFSFRGIDLANKVLLMDLKSQNRKLLILLADEVKYLDSLRSAKAISVDYFNYYLNRNKYLRLSIDGLLDLSNLKLVENLKEVKTDSTCFKYDFFEKFIDIASDQLYIRKIPLIRSNSSIFYDSRIAFKIILKDTLMNLNERNRILEKQINHIAENFPKDVFNKYFKIFKQSVKDTIAVNRINNRFLNEYSSLQRDVKNINLINSKKEKLTFEGIKSALKGRVLYVDFWASWCLPCREQMPEAKKLRAAYKGKEIDFLYLSIDNDYSAWTKAADEDRLLTYSQSYLLLNMGSSQKLLDLHIKSIPRYLLFNKKGELVSQNAPSPSSVTLKPLLDKYLKEQ